MLSQRLFATGNAAAQPTIGDDITKCELVGDFVYLSAPRDVSVMRWPVEHTSGSRSIFQAIGAERLWAATDRGRELRKPVCRQADSLYSLPKSSHAFSPRDDEAEQSADAGDLGFFGHVAERRTRRVLAHRKIPLAMAGEHNVSHRRVNLAGSLKGDFHVERMQFARRTESMIMVPPSDWSVGRQRRAADPGSRISAFCKPTTTRFSGLGSAVHYRS